MRMVTVMKNQVPTREVAGFLTTCADGQASSLKMFLGDWYPLTVPAHFQQFKFTAKERIGWDFSRQSSFPECQMRWYCDPAAATYAHSIHCGAESGDDFPIMKAEGYAISVGTPQTLHFLASVKEHPGVDFDPDITLRQGT